MIGAKSGQMMNQNITHQIWLSTHILYFDKIRHQLVPVHMYRQKYQLFKFIQTNMKNSGYKSPSINENLAW